MYLERWGIDEISLLVDLLGFIATVVIFVITSIGTRKATEEQTRRECIRATLTDFSNIMRSHQGLESVIKSENRTDVLRGYLADLERFAVGCNKKAYTAEVVNQMSGGRLVNLYNLYFRDFITERRRLQPLDAAAKSWSIYTEYENMMHTIFSIRGIPWEEPILRAEEMVVLDRFLHMRISTVDDIFAEFRKIEGAIEEHGQGKEGYLYIPGTRSDRCVIVAHADTYFDEVYQGKVIDSNVGYKEGYYYSESEECSIGADDRAGCAMLWLLRNSGHSLLILDGEEHGQVGTHYLRDSNPSLFDEINDHSFILQLDRRGSNDYKYYQLPVTKEFIKFIEKATGYILAQGKGRTDICALCTKICGINLSVGYYDEHKSTEKLCYSEWLHTYQLVKNMLERPLKKYLLKETSI